MHKRNIIFLKISSFRCYFYHLSYRGTSGIDIDLRKVDINQCPAAAVDDQEIDDQIETGSKKHDIFGGTDKCKSETTKVSFEWYWDMPKNTKLIILKS